MALASSTFPSYPIPTSYPQIFKTTRAPETLLLTNTAANTVRRPRTKAITVISSLTTTPTTASELTSYATFISNYAKQGDLAQEAWSGVEKDDLKQLAEDLLQMSDGYRDGLDGEGLSDEDGEYEMDV